ncbi:mammalian cell entry protein, partial [Nocardia sp. NPDC003246]
QSVRDFSNRVTAMSGLLAEQAPGLQATLDQLNAFLANTSTTFGDHEDDLTEALLGLTEATAQLRANSDAMVEIVDIVPLLMQNIDGAIDHERRFVRIHALVGTALSGEIVSVFCERVQMKSDGCRSGNMQDFGPDYGLTAALLGLTK